LIISPKQSTGILPGTLMLLINIADVAANKKAPVEPGLFYSPKNSGKGNLKYLNSGYYDFNVRI